MTWAWGEDSSTVAYLIEVLVKIAHDLEDRMAEMSPAQQAAQARAVLKQTSPCAPMPDFSGFHPAFLDRQAATPEGDVRRAFFLSYDDSYCEYLQADDVEQRMEAGQPVVSATFVTPYPPGFPVLVPGQLFSADPGLHAQPGHPRGARLRPAGRLPGVHRQGAADRHGRARAQLAAHRPAGQPIAGRGAAGSE